jgi:hypothetical protein
MGGGMPGMPGMGGKPPMGLPSPKGKMPFFKKRKG